MRDALSATSPAPWPDRLLDVPALLAGGWRPVPFREIVIKVHQRCNLACDYCYVYTMADQSWRSRPATMAAPVRSATVAAIAAHARSHRLGTVRVVLHGGEPLLAGVPALRALVDEVRTALPGGCRAEFALQTNGVLLDEPAVAGLAAAEVRIGVSLDGTPEQNDMHRRGHDGRGTARAVHRALDLLRQPRYRAAYGGLLCAVDPDTDPIACYTGLLRHAPPAVDFLFPHANWSQPPPRGGRTPYGDWLVRVFDRWFDAPRRETAVRLFDDIVGMVLGGAGRSEQVGLSPVAVVVVETDGSIEQVDALKSAYPGACATGRNVRTDPLDAALLHPGVAARQLGVAALGPTCQRCPVHRVCGGGHYAHRYRAGEGFRNPSVYCEDLRRLITHVRDRVGAELRGRVAATTVPGAVAVPTPG